MLGFADHVSNTLEYAYDANGNLTRDDNKGIVSITYNYLNLPSEIKFDDGNKIDYLYDAFGNKLAKRVTTNTTNIQRWDYLPGSIYHTTNSGAPVLDMVATPQGKAVPNSLGIFDYQYFLTDHLGNVRVVFGDDNDDGIPDIIQEDHYYPFGLRMYGLSTISNIGNKFLYQAKELQPDEFTITINSKQVNTRLELYDFHARFYDPQLGRWHVPDPVNQHISPYLAMGNNPVMMTDPDGMKDDGPIYRMDRISYGSISIPWLISRTINLAEVEIIAQRETNYAYQTFASMESFDPVNPMLPTTQTGSMGPIGGYGDGGGGGGTGSATTTSASDGRNGVGGNPYKNRQQYKPKPRTLKLPEIKQSHGFKYNNDGSASGQGGGWLDNIQTGLDVAGIADPTGIVDGVNALIYAGRGQWGNAGISALAIIPYIGDVGKAGRLGAKTLQLTSRARTAENGLELAGKFLKPGYTEIAPGVFRSSDQLRQFRMTTSDITGAHGPGPHFNFEIFSPLNLNKAATNYHVPIINP